MPVPPRGVTRWAASPIRNVLSRRKSSAICAANEKAPILSICGSSSGTPAPSRISCSQPLLVEVGRLLDLGIPVHAVEPAVVPSGGQEEAHGIGTDDAVDAVPMLADHVPERRPEQRGDDLGEVIGALAWGCPERGARCCAHRPPRRGSGPHDPLVARSLHPAETACTPSGPLSTLTISVANSARASAVGAQVAQHHGLEVILRRARRLDGAEEDGLLRYRHADLDRGTGVGACERLALQHQPARVDRACAHLLLQPPHADQLHGAGADGGRPRQLRRLGAPLDEQRSDAVACELEGGRESCRPGAHDQHRHVVFEFMSHCKSPSDSVYFEIHLVLRWTPCQVNTVGLP